MRRLWGIEGFKSACRSVEPYAIFIVCAFNLLRSVYIYILNLYNINRIFHFHDFALAFSPTRGAVVQTRPIEKSFDVYSTTTTTRVSSLAKMMFPNLRRNPRLKLNDRKVGCLAKSFPHRPMK